VGAIVGSTLAAACLAAGAVYFFWRRRQVSPTVQASSMSIDMSYTSLQE
jgi:hypothetical protein